MKNKKLNWGKNRYRMKTIMDLVQKLAQELQQATFKDGASAHRHHRRRRCLGYVDTPSGLRK